MPNKAIQPTPLRASAIRGHVLGVADLGVRLHLSAFFAYILWRPAFGNIQTRYLKSIKAKAAHHFPIWAGGAIMGLSAAKANKSDAGNGSGLVCRVHGSHLLAVA